MIFDIIFVLILICVNGLLAMSELAIVSARPARLRVQAAQGSLGAGAALKLASDPGRFLSTVQIGITLVGILAGAFSGATIGARLAEVLPRFGIPESLANEVGVGLVVMVITYLSLIVGELVPKQIALAAPERTAARVAPLMLGLARIAAPLVWVLDRSGKVVLKGLGQSGRREEKMSDEDIRTMLADAAGAGIIHRAEKELIGGVMRFSDRRARGLMTPRHEVEIVEMGETHAQILARFAASGHSRLPLRNGEEDNIVGILHSRDLLVTPDADFDALALVRRAPIVQDTLSALDVVDKLRGAPGHMVLVYDEFGHFKGIITPMDVLGTIAGGFDEHEMDGPKITKRGDGSMLISGWMPIDEFSEHLGIILPDTDGFETVAGLVLNRIRDTPRSGQRIEIDDWHVEIVDMDGLRIDKLLVTRKPNTN